MMIPAINVPNLAPSLRAPECSVSFSDPSNDLEKSEELLKTPTHKEGTDVAHQTDQADISGVTEVATTNGYKDQGPEAKTGELEDTTASLATNERSLIIHRDENGFGLRLRGQLPVHVEHVHENGAAWRAGVRALDQISKVNGIQVANMDHKEVVLMFKNCSRFVCLTLTSPLANFKGSQDVEQRRTPSELPSNRSTINDQMAAHRRDIASRLAVGALTRSSLMVGASSSMGLVPALDHNMGDTRYSVWSSRVADCPVHRGQHQPLIVSSSSLHSASAACTCNWAALSTPTSASGQPQSEAASSSALSPLPGVFKETSLTAARRSESVSVRPQSHNLSTSSQQLYNLRQQHLRRQPSLIQQPTDGFVSAKNLSGSSPLPVQQQQQQQQQQQHQKPDGTSGKSTHLTLSASTSFVTQSEAGATRVDPNAVSSESQTATPTRRSPVNKRLEIIKEFIDTERAHTERLRCLDELFYRPLKVGNYLTNEQLRLVFSCHKTLYKIHRQIYRILLSANHNNNGLYAPNEPLLVGSALLEIFEGDLKRRLERASCSFCSAQSINNELLNKLTRRDTKAGEFLAQVTSQQMVGRLGIKDLLASCFQRLTKYPLLLESLLKATPLQPEVNTTKVLTKKNLRRSGLFVGAAQLDGGEINDDDIGDYDENEDEDEDEDYDEEDEESNSRRILAISLAEEREFIERALTQSRQILVRVNEAIKVAESRQKLKEIWKRTDKYPGVPLIDITKQQVVHEGILTLRLSKRSFDVYMLLLNDYIIILSREGQDKYRLKFFTPEGKASSSLASAASSLGSPALIPPALSSSTSASGSGSASTSGLIISGSLQAQVPSQPAVYSPIFIIDEHLATRDAATDENGFYLLCKRKDDSRIYEFASRSPAERLKWRDRIQRTIETKMSKTNRRRSSCGSTITKSSSEISTRHDSDDQPASGLDPKTSHQTISNSQKQQSSSTNIMNKKVERKPSAQFDADVSASKDIKEAGDVGGGTSNNEASPGSDKSTKSSGPMTRIEGTISYVEDDGIVMPSNMESSKAFVDRAIQVNIFDNTRKPIYTK